MMATNMPQMGVKAVFDDSEAQTRMAAYQKRMKGIERALNEFAAASETASRKSERASKRSADAQKKSSDAQIKALVQLRRQLITIIFFMRYVTRAIVAAWKQMVDGMETQALVQGVRALASAYGQSLHEITQSMSEFAGSVADDMHNVRAAQAGLLADHGRFVEHYNDLWQAARVASVTAGGDAVKIFGQLVEALDKADAEAVDAASAIYNVEMAMLKFAVASGRTRDELTDQEKRQVILNEVMRTTSGLLESGAQAALDQQDKIGALKKSWEALKSVVSASLEPLVSIQGVINTLTQIIIMFAASIAATVTGVKEFALALKELITLEGEGDRLQNIGDRMFDAYVETMKKLTAIAYGPGPDEPAGAAPTGALAPSEMDDSELEDRLRAYEEFLKKIHSLRERYMKEMETLELRYTQRLEQLEIMRQQRLQEIFIKAQRKRQELWIQLQRRLEDADRDYYRALERLEQQNARRRERIWQRYWQAVRRINRKFMEDIYDAIAARDATAALKAIRKRKADLEDAAYNRNLALQNLRRDNELQLEELKRRRERAIEDAHRYYQQGLEDLARWIKQEQEDLIRHIEYQRQQIENWHKWRLQAIANQYKLEYLAAYVAYTGQEELLAEHVQRMNAIWAQMISALNIPPIPPPPGTGAGGVTGQQQFAQGGVNIFDRPTRILVGEGTRPEMVMAVPIGGQTPAPVQPGQMNVSHRFSGAMDHRVQAEISGAIAGLEGRVRAAIVDTLQRLM
jgi:hypothetical protein